MRPHPAPSHPESGFSSPIKNEPRQRQLPGSRETRSGDFYERQS